MIKKLIEIRIVKIVLFIFLNFRFNISKYLNLILNPTS